MPEPKWSAIAQLWYDHPEAGYDRQDVIKKTRLPSSYVGKYLSIMNKNGILRRQISTRRYFLASQDLLDSLINRSVTVTARSEDTRPPPPRLTQTHPHAPMLEGTLSFRSCGGLIIEYGITATNPANKHICRLTGPKDNAGRVIIYGKAFTAIISMRTFNGNIWVHDKLKYLDELQEVFGEEIHAQAWGRKLRFQNEVGLSPAKRQLLYDMGLKTGLEEPGSQTGDPLAGEIHGASQEEIELILKYIMEDKMGTGAILARMHSEQKELRLEMQEVKGLMSMQLTATANNTQAIKELAGALKATIKPQETPYQSPPDTRQGVA